MRSHICLSRPTTQSYLTTHLSDCEQQPITELVISHQLCTTANGRACYISPAVCNSQWQSLLHLTSCAPQPMTELITRWLVSGIQHGYNRFLLCSRCYRRLLSRLRSQTRASICQLSGNSTVTNCFNLSRY